MGKLRVPLTLIRNHQLALVDMIPCEVTSFVMAYPDIRRDLALVVLVAYVKRNFASTYCWSSSDRTSTPTPGVTALTTFAAG